MKIAGHGSFIMRVPDGGPQRPFSKVVLKDGWYNQHLDLE